MSPKRAAPGQKGGHVAPSQWGGDLEGIREAAIKRHPSLGLAPQRNPRVIGITEESLYQAAKRGHQMQLACPAGPDCEDFELHRMNFAEWLRKRDSGD